jgi:hypothetical protein
MLNDLGTQMRDLGAGSVVRRGWIATQLWRREQQQHRKWLAIIADEYRNLSGTSSDVDAYRETDAYQICHQDADGDSNAELFANLRDLGINSARSEQPVV